MRSVILPSNEFRASRQVSEVTGGRPEAHEFAQSSIKHIGDDICYLLFHLYEL
jgi:hypothetical protein